MKPIKCPQEFFCRMEEGLQNYFDTCDRHWGGILHFTVGVRYGRVGGIIKSERILSYEGYSLSRVEHILKYVLPKYCTRREVADIIGEVLSELDNEGKEPMELPEEEAKQTAPAEETPALTIESLPKRRRARRRKESSTDNQPQTQENNEKESEQ